MTITLLKKKNRVAGLSPKAAMLAALVEQTIAADPFELDGFLWAARPQEEWAGLIDASVATVRRIISRPPFVRDRTHDEGGYQLTVLRIGKPGKKTPRHLANIMVKIFEEHTKHGIGKRGYGCLIGCAEAWPEGYQIEIFRLVLKQWPAFMDGFRLALDTGQIVPPNPKAYAKPVPYLKMQHPHLPTLRLGAAVAVELYQMHMQAKAA